jgi:hypothetical protein
LGLISKTSISYVTRVKLNITGNSYTNAVAYA